MAEVRPARNFEKVFRETARETGGELLEVESVYTRTSPSRPPAHYHPQQEERFEVLSGVLHVRVGDEERELREGDVLVVPPGTTHEMWTEEAGTRMGWRTVSGVGDGDALRGPVGARPRREDESPRGPQPVADGGDRP